MKDRRRNKRAKGLAWLVWGCVGLGGLGGCAGPDGEPVEIQFVAQVGDLPAHCGERYDGVGILGAPVELTDARLYVSKLELHRSDGTTEAIELQQETPWQHAGVALLDFEDGTGRCSDSGTAQMNNLVVGSVAPGEYSGLSFEIGVPLELNHLDALSAPSPLNLNALYWNWRMGYIFNKVEFWNHKDLESAPGGDPQPGSSTVSQDAENKSSTANGVSLSPTITYLAHVGSTGCQSPAATMAPAEPCSRPNRSRVFLPNFQLTSHEVVLDFAGLVDGIDITQSVLRPPGCMAAPTDPDCRQVFANLGLDLETGHCFTDCSDQKLARERRIGAGQ